MAISYDKLWKLMKQNKMKKGHLAEAAEISAYTMTKLNKGYEVSMSVLVKICKALNCDLGDICEVISEN